MTKQTQKGVKIDCVNKQEAAFQLLKQKLCSAPILALPEGSEDFITYCDASKKGLGAVLMQREKCQRLKNVEALPVRTKCNTIVKFVIDLEGISEGQNMKDTDKNTGKANDVAELLSMKGTRTTKGSEP
ncbi:putative reverse transcriptase domain-containing protein [Tanacetum coccineum]